MTLTQLEYIVAVYNHKSFSVAASYCFVTQPTISMQVQKLEEEMSVVIFDRCLNPIGVTGVGENLIRQAKIILDEQVLKICKSSEKEWRYDQNKILFEFGSLDTLNNLVHQNFGMTLLILL
jgi:hypothetical protein